MNKEQVKKSLECCITLKADSCKECAYGKTDCYIDRLQRDALTLINEQEAEIERLQKKLVPVFMCVKDTNGGIDVEKLQKQAVKDFAEKLKQKYAQSCSEYYPELIILTSEQLDKLLKEYEK